MNYPSLLSRVALTVLASAATPVLAASYSYQYATSAGSFSVPVGQDLVIPIYLQETINGSGTSLIQGDGGLLGGGFAVWRTSTPSSPALLADIAGDGGFSGGFFPSPDNSATRLAGDNVAFIGAKPIPNGSGLIPLGTVTITGGSVVGEATTFSLGAADPIAGGYTQTWTHGYDLDLDSTSPSFSAATSSSFTVTTTAVPEPALLGVMAMGASLALRRKPK